MLGAQTIPLALAGWLKHRDLRLDVRAMRRHPQSRNPTLLCRDRRGKRVFVKSAVRGDPGVAQEQGYRQLPRQLDAEHDRRCETLFR